MIGFRKLFGFLVSMALLMGVFVICVISVPKSVTPMVIIGFLTGFLTDTFAFIGGNVWSKWIDFQKNKPSVAMLGTRYTGEKRDSYSEAMEAIDQWLKGAAIKGQSFDTVTQDDLNPALPERDKPEDPIGGVIDKLKVEYERLDSEAKKKVAALMNGETVEGVRMKNSVMEIPDEEEIQRGLMRAASGNEGSDFEFNALGAYIFPHENTGGTTTV